MKSSPEARYLHVAACVDKARAYGRGLLRGIASYVETFGVRWSLYIDAQGAGSYGAEWLENWHGDGILAYIEDAGLARRLHESGIPTVELFGHRIDLPLAQVGNDDEAIGRLAAAHLIERQFKHYAFSGYEHELWVQRRLDGFRQTLRQAGYTCNTLFLSRSLEPLAVWETSQARIAEWLKLLPKPAGLMACSDRHAHRILDACRRAHIAVPEETAVIGVDNDVETCRLCDPPLSSVIDNSEKIGFEAARLLDGLMTRPRSGSRCQSLWIPPVGVATRRSTDTTALEDRLVARAVRCIRQQACEGLTVDQLVRDLCVSRSHFYRRFSAATGRSPHEEILRVRLDKVKALLAQTDLSLEQIAELASFTYAEHLSQAFKQKTGFTPGRYRKRARA